MKLLFVTHDTSVYGASRSLRGLLRSYPGHEIDVMVPRLLGAPDDQALRRFFGPHVRRIFRRVLPFALCYPGRPRLQSVRLELIVPALWRLERARFLRFLAAERYDAIHLNSLVLHPAVDPRFPFVLHVRELLEGDGAAARASLARAHGVIFIDESTRAPFSGVRLRRSAILNNPIDMTALPPRPERFRDQVVFAVIGAISEVKGIEFIVRSFLGVRAPEARLLIVGQGDARVLRRSQQLAAADPRVVFWGEEPEIERIYAMTDHVVRGEDRACVGRTTYEGLFAGCTAVVPGVAADRAMYFEADRFADRLRLYPPRDRGALTAILEELASVRRLDRRGESNIADYVRRFDAVLADLGA